VRLVIFECKCCADSAPSDVKWIPRQMDSAYAVQYRRIPRQYKCATNMIVQLYTTLATS
jgi:hypothetical protein